MAFQQQSSFWVRLQQPSRSLVPPEEARTEPFAPEREAGPDGGLLVDEDADEPSVYGDELYPAYVDLDEQETVRDPGQAKPSAQDTLIRNGPPAVPASRALSTLRERHSKVDGLRTPSSAVRCAIPVTLRMLTGSPRALVILLDVDRVVVQAEHALPDQATVWIRLPFAKGSEVVRGRVTCSDRRTPSSPWEALVKLEVARADTRNGLVGLVRALKERARR